MTALTIAAIVFASGMAVNEALHQIAWAIACRRVISHDQDMAQAVEITRRPRLRAVR